MQIKREERRAIAKAAIDVYTILRGEAFINEEQAIISMFNDVLNYTVHEHASDPEQITGIALSHHLFEDGIL